MVNKINISIVKGNAAPQELQVKANNGVVDITGYTFQFVAKAQGTSFIDTDGSVKTTDAAINSESYTITDAVNGKATINLLLADTNITVAVYDYMIFMTDDSGGRSTIIEGAVTIRDTV
jgi:hypothetical protein